MGVYRKEVFEKVQWCRLADVTPRQLPLVEHGEEGEHRICREEAMRFLGYKMID